VDRRNQHVNAHSWVGLNFSGVADAASEFGLAFADGLLGRQSPASVLELRRVRLRNNAHHTQHRHIRRHTTSSPQYSCDLDWL